MHANSAKLKTTADYKHSVGTDIGKMYDRIVTFGEKHLNNICKQ